MTTPDEPERASVAAQIEAGRRAPPAELRRRVGSASAAWVEGAADNPRLGRVELLLLLRNRQAAPETLARLAARHDSLRTGGVRAALVVHPRAPLSVTRGLVGHLFWRELCEVAASPSIHPLLRRRAELLLRARLGELEPGERVTLARRASRALVGALVEDDAIAVLEALLGNPRLIEADAVRLASRESTPPALLGRLGAHPVWSARRSVRLGLARNPRTPIPAALGLLRGLPRRDLRALAKDDKVRRIIRIGAERTLARRGAVASRDDRPAAPA